MERMRKMVETMSEEERVRMMERCFEFLKGKDSGKEKERKEKEESSCSPDMGKLPECCPEIMETFFLKMKSCFEEKGKKEKKDTDNKSE